MTGIDYLCDKFKLKRNDLAVHLECPPQQINDWKSGRRPIPKHHLEKMCELFEISKRHSDIFLKSALTESNRSKIDLYHAQAKLENLKESDDNLEFFKEEIVKKEREVQILIKIEELQSLLLDQVEEDETFLNNLDKLENLIEDVKYINQTDINKDIIAFNILSKANMK